MPSPSPGGGSRLRGMMKARDAPTMIRRDHHRIMVGAGLAPALRPRSCTRALTYYSSLLFPTCQSQPETANSLLYFK